MYYYYDDSYEDDYEQYEEECEWYEEELSSCNTSYNFIGMIAILMNLCIINMYVPNHHDPLL